MISFRSHMLQAHTEEEFQAWVSAIQLGVTRAFREAEKQQSKSSVSRIYMFPVLFTGAGSLEIEKVCIVMPLFVKIVLLHLFVNIYLL